MRPMAKRLVRWVEWAGAVTVALAVASGVFVWYLNASDYRADLAVAVEQSTGLVVAIDGPLRFAMTPLPTVIAAEVRIANPPWSERAEMARIERVEMAVSPLDLLLHRNRILRLALYGADLHLERDRSGRANWWNADAAAAQGPVVWQPPDIGTLELHGSRLDYGDGGGRRIRLGLGEIEASLPRDGPFTARFDGDYFGIPVTGELTGGRYGDLVTDQPLWPMALRLEGAGTSLTAKGTLDRPMSEMMIDAQVSLAGLRLSSLAPVLGSPLPAIGPYTLAGRLSGGWGHYRLAGLKAHLGISDAAGEITVTTRGARPRLEGRLQGRVLNAVDLVPAATVIAALRNDGRLFDARPLPLGLLSMADGRLDLRLGHLVAMRLDLYDLDTSLSLEAGHLRVMPFRTKLADGRLDLALEVDGTAAPPRLHLSGHGDGLAAEQVLSALGMSQWPTGPMSLELDLTGEGDSPRALAAHASGFATMTIGQGTLPVRHFDLIASDLVASIMPWADRSGDRTDLHCIVAGLRLRDGAAVVERLLIDTDKITVTGAGEVNLAAERFDLRLDPRPKDPSLISLATRMRVAGSLTDYSAAPDPMGLARGAAAGIALSIAELNPLALMLPFVSMGTGVENPCPGAAVAQARVRGLAVFDPMRGINGLLDNVGRVITHTMDLGGMH